LKGIAVRFLRTVTSTRPPEGKAAFVRAAAMLSRGMWSAAQRPMLCVNVHQSNRNGGLSNPGEGST